MSRSHWASAKGYTPVSAAMRGAGKRAPVEDKPGLGCLLGALLSMTRLCWVVAVLATVMTFAPAPALAKTATVRHTQVPTTQDNRKTPTAKAMPGGRRSPHPQRGGPVRHIAPRPDVVLALGSGYDRPGGSQLVRSLQRRLVLVGFRPGPLDGLYGPRTMAAVARFQGSTGLPIDGIAGPATMQALDSAAPTLYPGAGFAFGGSRLVRRLQRLLARAGFDPYGIDGRYGPHTEHAVMRFQAVHHLRADGIAGVRTLSDLSRPVRTRHRPHLVIVRPRPAAPGRAPSPSPARRKPVHPSAPASVPWLGLLAVAVAAALLLTTVAHIRRRHGGQPGIAGPHSHDPRLMTGAAAKSLDSWANAGVGDDADTAFRFGVMYEEQHELAAAEAAYQRADAMGHSAAASNLGVLLERRGDLTGAEAAYRRAAGRGDPNGAFNLAVFLEGRNDLKAAEAAYERADGMGHPAAASNLGVLLERRGELTDAEEAYRRADERGDPNGAFNLAVLLEERNDLEAAEAAFERADRRGSAEVASAARAALRTLRANHRETPPQNGGYFHVD